MSRLFLKNIPVAITEERLKKHFEPAGSITDVRILKKQYNIYELKLRNGKARKIAFIGFKTHEEAEKAIKMFNKTFIDTSRVEIEYAKGV